MDPEMIVQFLNDELGVTSPLEHDEDLLAAGLIDSQGIVALVSFLEGELAIEIGDEDLVPENFQTVNAIAAFAARAKG